MPEPAERGTRARVVDLLRIAEGIAGYAARSVGNGLEPGAARRAALEAAGDLEAAASALRRLAGPDPVADPDAGARWELAAELAAAGWSPPRIAVRVGVTGGDPRRDAGILGPVNVSGPGGAGNTVIRGLTANEVRLWIILSACPATVGGRYEAREVTRLGVPLVEVVWVPRAPGAGRADRAGCLVIVLGYLNVDRHGLSPPAISA